MKVRAFQIFYKATAGLPEPADPALYAMAVEFAEKEIAKPIDIREYKHVWIACEVDVDDKPVRCLGMLAMVWRPDFCVARFLDNVATKILVERASDNLHDQGLRGQDVFVYIADDEQPEQRCPNYQGWLQAFGMKPAERWTFTIR